MPADEHKREQLGEWCDLLAQRENRRWTHFSWISVRSLLDSMNDKIAKNIHDLVSSRRQRWVAAQRAAGAIANCPDLKIPVKNLTGHKRVPRNFSFFVLGDPGEADGSQYCVVDALKKHADATHFMVILSDVIYPAGDINDYGNAFYLPYRWYRKPIVALPGNHDWYDGLNGFMYHFCGAEALAPEEYRSLSFTPPERAARWLWRSASRPERARLVKLRYERPELETAWCPPQPGPYFAVDSPSLRVVAIDTGITGTIDREQAQWLERVSAGEDPPKILLTGKPIYVDGKYKPGLIQWNEESPESAANREKTVDDIVRNPANNYVAVIGGDVHNYQRYTVCVREPDPKTEEPTQRLIEYIVAGGAGAYLSATHRIGEVDISRDSTENKGDEGKLPETVERIKEEDFRCYPLRGDSLAYYSRSFGRRVRSLTWGLAFFGLFYAASIAALAALELRTFESVTEPALVAFGTLIAGVAIGFAAWGFGTVMPSPYKAFTATAVPVVLVGGLVLLLDGVSLWQRRWEVALVVLGLVLIPTVVVVVAYFTRGAGPKMTRDLALALVGLFLLLVVAVLWGFHPPSAWTGVVAVAIVGLTLIVILVPTFGWLRRRHAAAYAIVVLYLFVFCGLVVTSLVREGAPSLFWTIIVSATTILIVFNLVLWFVLFRWRAGPPVLHRDLRNEAVSSNEAIKWVAQEYKHRPHGADARTNDATEISDRTQRVGKFLLTSPTAKRRWLDRLVSEVGDANEPPFFKSFLKLDVRHDDLYISCYGVTGWKVDSDDPPREDCVRIPLRSPPAPGRTDVEGDDAGTGKQAPAAAAPAGTDKPDAPRQ